MRKLSTRIAAKQTGFTLIELVIVMVIIGILGSVAMMKMSNITDAAHKASNTAVLGMVRSAWVASYAINKGAAVIAGASGVEGQTSDPQCTDGTNAVNCPVSWISSTGAAGNLTIDIPSLITSAGIACHTPADCS